MVRRMAVRGMLVAPLVVAALWLFGSSRWALSGGIGLALTLLNLWLAARIIGAIADRSPHLLLPGALAAFALGLALLLGLALALRAIDLVYFPVTGFTLIGSHFGLVLWEAAGAYGRIPRGQRPAAVSEDTSGVGSLIDQRS